jgi:hypothetical protein
MGQTRPRPQHADQLVQYEPGANGDVEAMQASFEQHCEGATAALRGTVTIGNPTPPPVELGLAIAPDGTFSRLNGGPPCTARSPAIGTCR